MIWPSARHTRARPAACAVGAQDQVGLGVVHDLAVDEIAGDGLEKHRFGQAQAAIRRRGQELLGRQDLAARDAGHVGDEALHLGHRALAQPGGDVDRERRRGGFGHGAA
jgi:hypothetical protein